MLQRVIGFSGKVMVGMMLLGVSYAGIADELLPNAGFAEQHPGDTQMKDWRFEYNTAVKGSFANDSTFAGKTPVLTLDNPVKDKEIFICSSNFTISQAGKYKAVVWAKADENAGVLQNANNKLAIKSYLIRADWKKFFEKNLIPLQKVWTKYEFDFTLVQEDVNAQYVFRVDIHGTGRFQIAGITLSKVE